MEPQNPTKIHLVKKTARGKRSSRWLGKHFASGKRIRESGIYRVRHAEHRLPHEVTLLKGEEFPVCLQCQGAVDFELLRPVPEIHEMTGFLVRLHALPEVERRRQPREPEQVA